MEKGASSSKPVSELKAMVRTSPRDVFQEFYYQPVRILGQGMSGKVVLAQSRHTNKLEAVKLLSKKTRDRGMAAKLFLQEISILQNIKHKNIVGNVVAYDCPEEYAMSMPYYKEGTLTSRLKCMTKELTDKYFLQLSGAILYLHLRQLVHRDIKPDNVLISDDGNVILSDFGLACALQTVSSTPPPRCGTRRYMAPELLDSKKHNLDLYKCDSYSLGVVLWTMVFRGVGKPGTVYLSHLHTQKHIPASYRCLMERLLHPDPDHRWNLHQLVNTLSTWPHMVHLVRHLLQ